MLLSLNVGLCAVGGLRFSDSLAAADSAQCITFFLAFPLLIMKLRYHGEGAADVVSANGGFPPRLR